MFDELQKEPEDVFAQTDASAPQMTPPTMSQPSQQSTPQPMQRSVAPTPQATRSEPVVVSPVAHRAFPWKVVVLVVGIIAVITLAFFLSMKILKSKTPVTPPAPEQSAAPESPVPSTPTVEIPQATTPEAVAPITSVPEETIDTDKDGLPDTREAQLGTDPNNPDTDADGLFDKEEVDVYHTNPLNSDTDGDTFPDGSEVKKGYNPNGPGKLLQVPQK